MARLAWAERDGATQCRAGQRNQPRRAGRSLTSLLLCSSLLGTAGLFAPQVASAQQPASTQAMRFDIAAQPLRAAINAFTRSTGWEVGFTSQAIAGKRSSAVGGTLPPAEALEALLAGTGLSVIISGPTTAAIVDPSARSDGGATEDGSIALDTISVEGEAIDNWNAPPSYAGGQVATGAKLGILGNTSVMDAPFNITGYTSKTIEDQQAVTVADVVANDPSVRVYTNGLASSAGVGDSFFIRGFSVGNYSILLDGYGGISADRIIPVETMESVEILKGPNALLNGYTQYGSLGGRSTWCRSGPPTTRSRA